MTQGRSLLFFAALAGSLVLFASLGEAALIFDGSGTFGSGTTDVTIQVKVWGPGYTAGEVAAGTIPNAAGATTGSIFYAYAYRITNLSGNDPILGFRINIGSSNGASFGYTTNDGGSGVAPIYQGFLAFDDGLNFRNTFGPDMTAGQSSQWLWLTSPLEPSLPSGYVLGDSVGGRFSRTSYDTTFTDVNLPSPNPEPATSLLFSTGLGGLAFWRRRQLGIWLKSRLRRGDHSPEGPTPA
jgi:hypothetical protein